MGRVAEERSFKIKNRIVEGVCRVIQDGKRCNRQTHCRGLCSKHHTYFLRWKLMNKYGAKQKFVYVEVSKYKINRKTKPGKCRIIENGENCTRRIHGRSLCARHWLTFERHDLLKKYGTSSRKDPRTFRLKKRIPTGICRVVEDDKGCGNKGTNRGLCSKHYLRFLRDGRLKKFAAKKKK